MHHKEFQAKKSYFYGKVGNKYWLFVFVDFSVLVLQYKFGTNGNKHFYIICNMRQLTRRFWIFNASDKPHINCNYYPYALYVLPTYYFLPVYATENNSTH